MNVSKFTISVLVMGGGTVGPVAAVKAKEANPQLRVLLLGKVGVERRGAIVMGMNRLRKAVLPGHATRNGMSRGSRSPMTA
ncbi:hypothetical protein A9R16_000825 [Acidiferrobacter thiooxydans]|jgi:succinate dehydrogenase/fumarate reductase flavoprotein subunit|uniref:Uncharacterized protein n=1 Tax=Acidiferrobacter thiooxydans TaxID=163359 RepID=A0A1C2G255_9GAMM|nr:MULTISPECIES: hypothetical protein [Acidiferrobacter]RCN58377.1 hypothetical protein C4900_00830 [Acidiferrobacter thiooxydans]UEN99974.1 hypothetical protein A9R16_000825 [Acidiferrobacter thiooxydans]